MKRRRQRPTHEPFGAQNPSLLELVDHLLNKGVVLHAEATLGLGGVELVYLRVAAVLGGVDEALALNGGP